jgi:subtilisin family serine protease
MKKILLFASMLFMLDACTDETTNSVVPNAPSNLEMSAADKIIPGKYIVVLKNEPTMKGMPDRVREKVLSLLTKNGANDAAVDHFYSTALQGFSCTLSPGLLKKLQADGEVDYIEADFEITIEQRGKGKPGGGGTPPPQTTPWGITSVGGSADGSSKTAWIIDTGIGLTHPDLNVDASRGFSAFSSGKDTGFDDGHGTHVAGTVAALNNSIGVIGVAAGAKVVPVKVLGARGSGSNSGVIAGVDHVAQYGQVGDAANMSLGGGISTALDQAVLNASIVSGVKFALAAGNESDDANNHSPARVNGANIYTVSAHDINKNFASFSNYGNPPIEYCAPGVRITSTWKDGGYNTISGTSMATPHVYSLLLLGTIANGGTVNNNPNGNPDILARR